MRHDFCHYDEAGAMAIYSEGLNGKARSEIFNAWWSAVESYLVMPVGKSGDGDSNLRLILGELNEPEVSEWIGKISWVLKVPDGRLVIEAAFEANEEAFAEFVEEGEIVYIFDVPAGVYEVNVYTYFPGPEYLACMEALGETEPFGSWFRRTRPNTAFPEWLERYFILNPYEDPENETHWQVIYEAKKEGKPWGHEVVEEPQFVEYVVQLQPLAGPYPQLDQATLREGWFEPNLNARKPPLCPQGIIYRGESSS